MCGQGGIAGTIDVKLEGVFKKLLILNSMRGTDSTGAASVKRAVDWKTKNIEVVVAKEIGHAYNLIERRSKDYQDFSDVLAGGHRVLLGHCRASTRGATTRDNAHPFLFENVVGTHNGTLSHTSHKLLKGFTRFPTDSESVFNEIELDGVSGFMKKVKGYKDPKSNITCEDAYALVWYDARDNTINFLRNKERPLWFVFDKDHKTIFWSSEGFHLVTATAEVVLDKEDKFYELPADKHFSWVIPDHGKAFGKPRVTERRGQREDLPFVGGGKNNHKSAYKSLSHIPQDDPDDCAAPFFHTEYGFWGLYNMKAHTFKYSAKENGTYYYDIQKAWDDLDPEEQRKRVIQRNIPPKVHLPRWKYDDKTNQYVRVPPDVHVPSEKEKAVSKVNQTIADQVVQKKLLDTLKEIPDSKYFCEKFKDERRRLFYDIQNKNFNLFTFLGHSVSPSWDRQTLTKVPMSIPFTPIDINARHCFKHKGRGKRKIIYYRGFNKSMLVRESFEKIMLNGCCNCDRKPAWGNEVRFVSNEMFLCEFCMSNLSLVQEWELLASSEEPEKKEALN